MNLLNPVWPDGCCSQLICTGSPAKTEVDSIRIHLCQGSELLGDNQRWVIWKHDSSRPDPDRFSGFSHMPQQNGGCWTGDIFHIVVFGHPEPFITQLFHMNGQITAFLYTFHDFFSFRYYFLLLLLLCDL